MLCIVFCRLKPPAQLLFSKKVMDDFVQAANNVVQEKTAKRTKQQYASGLNQIKKFLATKCEGAHLSSGGEIEVPLPEQVLKAYFGSVQMEKSKRGTPKSFSSVSGYRSALKYYYVEKGVSKAEIERFDEFTLPFLQGMK